jgi:hypothetical protein
MHVLRYHRNGNDPSGSLRASRPGRSARAAERQRAVPDAAAVELRGRLCGGRYLVEDPG